MAGGAAANESDTGDGGGDHGDGDGAPGIADKVGKYQYVHAGNHHEPPQAATSLQKSFSASDTNNNEDLIRNLPAISPTRMVNVRQTGRPFVCDELFLFFPQLPEDSCLYLYPVKEVLNLTTNIRKPFLTYTDRQMNNMVQLKNEENDVSYCVNVILRFECNMNEQVSETMLIV